MDVKGMLYRTMLDLLEKEDIEDITVLQLVERAGLSRSTFYNHYVDKYDLLTQQHVAEQSQIIEDALAQDLPYKDYILKSIRTYDHGPAVYGNSMEGGGDLSMLSSVERLSTEYTQRYLALRGCPALDEKAQTVLAAYIHGSSRLLMRWLSGEVGFTHEELADILYRIIPSEFKKHLY